MQNQRGFATLEMILVVLIIAILTTVALPKMARMIDIAALDYEVKKFCSDFDFAHSLGRQAELNTEIFGGSIYVDEDSRFIVVNIESNGQSYQLRRKTTTEDFAIREKHILNYGIKIKPDNHSQIAFKFNGKVTDGLSGAISESFAFKSRYNEFYVSVDSVGRWRGKRERR